MVCINLGFTSFGCKKNDNSSVKIDIEKVSKTISNSIMNNISDDKTVVVSTQNQNINIKGNCCNPISIDQTSEIKVINTTEMNVQMITDIAQKFKSGLTKEIDDKSNLLKNFLGQQVGTQLTATIKNAISKISESNSFKSSIQKKISETFANQGQNISIDCGEQLSVPRAPSNSGLPNTGCYISQSFLYEQVTNNIMETMMSDILRDDKVDELIASITRKNISFPLQNTGKLERTTLSWFESNLQTIALVLLIFFIPLIIKFIKVM